MGHRRPLLHARDARRLADAFPDGELVEVPGVTTFVSLDEPAAVTDAVLGRAHGVDGAGATGQEASVS